MVAPDAVCGRRSGLCARDETPVPARGLLLLLPGIGGRRSGLGARVGAAVENAVPGSDGIGEPPPPGVGGCCCSSPPPYREARVLRRAEGLGARLEAAERQAPAGVEGKSVVPVGVEKPLVPMDRDILGRAATCAWSLMEVLCRASRSVIHCATGKRCTELRARMRARVEVEEARADWIADLNWRTRCLGAMDWLFWFLVRWLRLVVRREGVGAYFDGIPPAWHLTEASDPRSNTKSTLTTELNSDEAERLVTGGNKGELGTTE